MFRTYPEPKFHIMSPHETDVVGPDLGGNEIPDHLDAVVHLLRTSPIYVFHCPVCRVVFLGLNAAVAVPNLPVGAVGGSHVHHPCDSQSLEKGIFFRPLNTQKEIGSQRKSMK